MRAILKSKSVQNGGEGGRRDQNTSCYKKLMDS